MPYRLQKEESLPAGLKRVAEEQVTVALVSLQSSQSLEQRIYAARKSLKKARAILRLLAPQLGPIYQQENRRLRDVAQRFSDLRDNQVCFELLAKFAAGYKSKAALTPQRNALTARHAALQDTDWQALTIQSIHELTATRKRIEDWPLRNLTNEALYDNIRKTHKESRQALQKADTTRTPENFHEFRKSVKRELNQASLVYGKDYPLESLKHLATLLGDHHNLAIFMANTTDSSKRFEARIMRELRHLETRIISTRHCHLPPKAENRCRVTRVCVGQRS